MHDLAICFIGALAPTTASLIVSGSGQLRWAYEKAPPKRG